MNSVTLDNITVAGDVPTASLRYALFKAALAQLSSPGRDGTFKKLDVDYVRTWAISHLQRERAEQHQRQLPAQPAQIAVYLAKANQAQHWQNDAAPDQNDYPALYGLEAHARQWDPGEVAKTITTQHRIWLAVADRIEAVATAGIAAIQQAPTTDHILQALASVEWPSP
jgi:hypothetical protein